MSIAAPVDAGHDRRWRWAHPAYVAGVTTLALATEKCNGCLLCTDVCPHGVFAAAAGRVAVVARDACMECGACARNCPEGALSVRAGVGCAYAIMLGRIRGGEPSCGCDAATSACCEP